MSRSKLKLPTYPIPLWVQIGGLIGALAILTVFLVIYLPGHNFGMLSPAGHIASREKRLMLMVLALSLVVVIPVFIMLFAFAWKYREGNKAAKYSPELGGNRLAETVWWAIPIAIIGFLSFMTWQSSHELDPFKPLVSTTKPLTIQVVALEWKWLFIYPEQHIASLNYVQFPVNTPLNFQITSDAPMNSFWIPQLGGQIYAMSGMTTELHLTAAKPGDYRGMSANISGDGFADMHFTARASSAEGFSNWLSSVRQASTTLDTQSYNALAKPSKTKAPIASYGHAEAGLYDRIIMKYMMPGMTTANGDLVSASAVAATEGNHD